MPGNFGYNQILITPYLLHFYSWMQEQYPSILWMGNASRQAVALTFDDGPHPGDTPRVLDVLAKHNERATFHLVGKQAERHPNLVKQIHECGHQLALHCYRHVPFPVERPHALRIQLENTRNVIAASCGLDPETIRDVRPPYGAFSRNTLSYLTEWNYRLVMWNCMPPHWMQPVGWSIRQVMESIVPGAVIVLHDGHGHGTRVAEIVDTVVPRIKAMGYEFVTVEDMHRNKGK
jgi:peptidoglycan/xylan/chitin deacetylase (PgdA/CDA1 family)